VPLSDTAIVHLGEPVRGDVVTFSSPTDGTRLIKRIVALPGDVVEMRGEVLVVNGAPASYTPLGEAKEARQGGPVTPAIRAREQLAGREHSVQFLPELPAMRSFGPVTVPPGQYFVLGDNRDDSADSRYIGFVPRRLLIGRAHHVLVSADIVGNWLPRLDRFGSRIR
jgi:signal peptidase I